MADHPYIMPIFSKTLIKINSFDSYPYSCRYSSFKCIKVGLLTHPVCCAFPAFASGKECNKLNSLCKSRDTQQQELFRILTGFPFHSSASKCGFRAPCAQQMYGLLFDLPNISKEYFLFLMLISMI